ncbi:MAG: sigma-70 family RNA polymerase sigma factor [Acidobacteriota bacterium]|nr:sigma-70 family RNA polymerase sigma factor [Acidobacteriota bacterium]
MTTAKARRGGPRKSRQNPDERQLLERLVAGEPEALSELYDRYSGMLLGLSYKILHDASDAEEVLQEVFLQVWRQASRYDSSKSSISTWLVLITRSRSIDRLRSRKVVDKTVTAAHVENPRTHASPEGVEDVLTIERRNRLLDELRRLPQEQREVLELSFYRGLTQREIAQSTDTPLGTVKTRTLLAMKKLRQALQEDIRDLL